MRRCVLGLAVLLAAVAAPAMAQWATGWDDGQAEVAAYALAEARYGVERLGDETIIVVSEVQDRETLVKALPDAPDAVRRPVIKVNRELTLPTGVYSYRQYSSAFVDRATDEVTKIAMSSQEWCGTTYVEALSRGGKLRVRSFSYLEGDGDRTFDLDWPKGAWAADALPALVRTLPDAPEGVKEAVPFLASLVGNRVREPRLVMARIAWTSVARVVGESAAAVTGKPAATLRRVTITTPDGDHVLDVEDSPARRVLSWTRPGGGHSRLLATDRLAYWKLNNPGDESRKPGR